MENRRLVLSRLKKLLPAHRVLTDTDECRLYDCDGLTLHRGVTPGVLLLETENEVVEVVKVLADARVPFVARGAGTGLSGGAIPLDKSWVLDVHRMRRIIEIDPLQRTAVIEPGVINLDLDRAAAVHGLRFAPDPSSQRACTVGGNIAENSGGPHCFLHGSPSSANRRFFTAWPDLAWLTLVHNSGSGLEVENRKQCQPRPQTPPPGSPPR